MLCHLLRGWRMQRRAGRNLRDLSRGLRHLQAPLRRRRVQRHGDVRQLPAGLRQLQRRVGSLLFFCSAGSSSAATARCPKTTPAATASRGTCGRVCLLPGVLDGRHPAGIAVGLAHGSLLPAADCGDRDGRHLSGDRGGSLATAAVMSVHGGPTGAAAHGGRRSSPRSFGAGRRCSTCRYLRSRRSHPPAWFPYPAHHASPHGNTGWCRS